MLSASGVLRLREFRLLLVGRAVSVPGDRIVSVALAFASAENEGGGRTPTPAPSSFIRRAPPGEARRQLGVVSSLGADGADGACGAPPPPPGPKPSSVPVTSKSFDTATCCSPSEVITCTTYEPSGSCMTRSTSPGYLAVAAA